MGNAMPTVPPRASALTTCAAGVGLLTCVYLGSLKLLNIPCPLSGCWDIINSRYGSVLGIPLPLFAVPLWAVLALGAERPWLARAQVGAAFLLAAGGLALMGVQFGVLHGFCPFCTLHAAAALVAAFAVPRRGRAHAWLPALVLTLALPLFLAVKLAAEARVQSWDAPGYTTMPVIPKAGRDGRPARSDIVPASSMVSLQASLEEAAFPWLGPVDERSPILVVSFQCPHCLDLLGQVLKHPRFGAWHGPRVLLFTSPENSADSMAVLAAILSEPGTPREQFTAVFSQLGMLFDPLLTRDSKALRARLAALCPQYPGKIAEAKRLLDANAQALQYLPGKGTPFLLRPDGSGKYEATPADLLFP